MGSYLEFRLLWTKKMIKNADLLEKECEVTHEVSYGNAIVHIHCGANYFRLAKKDYFLIKERASFDLTDLQRCLQKNHKY